jgi:hypothetical protein
MITGAIGIPAKLNMSVTVICPSVDIHPAFTFSGSQAYRLKPAVSLDDHCQQLLLKIGCIGFNLRGNVIPVNPCNRTAVAMDCG